MRILIHGLNFSPELVGVGKFTGEMAEWLAKHGHEVHVVTAPPFNPASRVSEGYSAWSYRREHQRSKVEPWNPSAGRAATGMATAREELSASSPATAGILTCEVERSDDVQDGSLTVFRCPVWVPATPSAGKRILHLASFAFSSFWSMIAQISWRPDVVLVIEPTLLCAPNAWITAQFCGAKSWIHIQDLETDAAFELGILRSSWLRWLLLGAEAKCLQSFHRVSTISQKMGSRVLKKGVRDQQYVQFPNWVNTQAIFPLANPSSMRDELGIPRDAIVSLYSGTMAQKQGLEILRGAVEKLQTKKDLHFVFCGDGPGRSALTELGAKCRNVHFVGLQPISRLNDLLNLADIHLLPQRADAADLVMPSKLTGMLASGRPVVVSAARDTQLAHVVEGCGIVVPPGDTSAFAWAIEELTGHSALREKFGRNGRAYAVANLERNVILGRFEEELRRLVSNSDGGERLSN